MSSQYSGLTAPCSRDLTDLGYAVGRRVLLQGLCAWARGTAPKFPGQGFYILFSRSSPDGFENNTGRPRSETTNAARPLQPSHGVMSLFGQQLGSKRSIFCSFLALLRQKQLRRSTCRTLQHQTRRLSIPTIHSRRARQPTPPHGALILRLKTDRSGDNHAARHSIIRLN
jgi:hypothetical protein